MIPPSLLRLKALHVELIAALDGDDVERIEQTAGKFPDCLDEVRAQGAWKHRPELIELIFRICRLSEAARIRVNFLTDRNQRRLDALAELRGRAAPGGYGSDGKRAA